MAVIRCTPLRLAFSILIAFLAVSSIWDRWDGTWEPWKFYTYLSNTLVAVVFIIQSVFLVATIFGRPLRLPAGFKGFTALCILLTFLTVFLVLNPFGRPSGWLDTRVHYLVPLLTFAEWLLFEPHGQLKPRHLMLWPLTPLAYYGYVLILHSLDVRFGGNRFPYFFMDYHTYGWDFVLRIMCVLAGIFLLFGFLMLLYDRFLGKRRAH